MRVALVLLVAFLTGVCACSSSNRYQSLNKPEIRPEDLQQMIMLLASDSLQGREAGSESEALAADFIVREFEAYGLLPAGEGDSFYQEFPFIKGSIQTPDGSRLSAGDIQFTSADSSIFPYSTSKPGDAEGLLAFAGYGIVDSLQQWDDFNDADLTGHIVMMFRYGPDGADNPHSAFGSHWAIRKKVRNAQARGAIAVLLVVGPDHANQTEILPLKEDRFAAEEEIPVLQLKLSAATQLAAEAGLSLTNLQARLDKERRSNPVLTTTYVALTAGIQKDKRRSRNIAAKLKGTGSKNEMLVIGAHYDHLGFGDHGSLYQGAEPKIHNGADDNASGTAGLLELAAFFSKNKPQHDVLFLAFGAEELGLLGSDYWVKNPTVPLENLRCMLNMDMIGRMTDRRLQVFGVGSSADWPGLVTAANADSLVLTQTPDGTGASDHTSFYNAGIPVLHYFTGTHSDYHRPSDDASFINYTGLGKVLEHMVRLVEAVDVLPDSGLAFTKAPVTQNRRVAMTGITLGVLPDYGFSGPGFKITGVSEGKLGAKLGMTGGDIIHEINGAKIKDIYDYMESLNTIKKGGAVVVEIERSGKRRILKAVVD